MLGLYSAVVDCINEINGAKMADGDVLMGPITFHAATAACVTFHFPVTAAPLNQPARPPRIGAHYMCVGLPTDRRPDGPECASGEVVSEDAKTGPRARPAKNQRLDRQPRLLRTRAHSPRTTYLTPLRRTQISHAQQPMLPTTQRAPRSHFAALRRRIQTRNRYMGLTCLPELSRAGIRPKPDATRRQTTRR